MAGVPYNPLAASLDPKRRKENPIASALLASTQNAVDSFNASPFSQAMNSDINRNISAVASALMAPGDALSGKYNYVEIEPDGYVRPFNSGLMNAANNMASVVGVGSLGVPRPAASLGSGGRPINLPFSESLSTPPIPSPSQLAKLGRVESVPITSARATNSLQWEKFNSGSHPPELVPGYGDKPVAIRKENGEYIIVDGHHRTALAASNGSKTVDMYVIDAKDYAPGSAGRPAAPQSMSDDDILKALGF